MIYTGKIEKMDVKLVTTAGIKGILSNILQTQANLVNAPLIARERGIKIIEKKISQEQDAPGVVTMKVTTDKGEGLVSGTVTGNNEERIIAVDDYKIDLIPSGYVLITFHKDRPGIVGKVGTLLGKNDINIAYMQVGRKSYRGEALMALGVDENIPDEVLREIRKIEDMANAVLIRF
jgi:D-3-phosphoglycerate dehydrogenase